jgi:inorganic pyrophosphatase
MEHFFTVYKQLEKKKTAVLGWRSLAVAETVIAEALARYRR